MGRVILVRHGQASFFGASYDRLSALGREQARALGEHWATHGVGFDRVYVGPRLRHRETAEQVAAAYAARGLPWPQAVELPELDEHHGLTVIKHQLGRKDLDNDALHPGEIGDGEREHAVRQFFRQYLEIMREWARGSIVVDGVEPWAQFRARSLRALDVICSGPGIAGRSGSVSQGGAGAVGGTGAGAGGSAGAVAFTSGGLVSAAVGWLLGLDEDRVIDLSIVLRNTGLTEVSHSGRRRSLVSFNALPHLADPKYATAV